MGWSNLENGDLLRAAESTFDLLVTTDQNLRHQQNLAGRRLAILALPSANWPLIQRHLSDVITAIERMQPGEYQEVTWTD